MNRYTDGQKEAAIQRMMPPQNQPVKQISEEMGIPVATLYLWRRKAQDDGLVAPGDGKSADGWTSTEKFRIVVETETMAQAELAAYCRERGLYPEQIQAWRGACEIANAQRSEQLRAQKANEKDLHQQIKELRKELRIKEKALAETAALLTLRKSWRRFGERTRSHDERPRSPKNHCVGQRSPSPGCTSRGSLRRSGHLVPNLSTLDGRDHTKRGPAAYCRAPAAESPAYRGRACPGH